MNKMKKGKVIASAVLTACFMVFSVLASVNLKPVNVYGATNVSVDNYVQNVITKTGANATASFVTNEAQINKTSKTFTGIKLTGSKGATFNLGKIDISKSYWNAVDFSYNSENVNKSLDEDFSYDVISTSPSEYIHTFNNEEEAANATSGGFKSFISLVPAPTTSVDRGELAKLTVTLTDATGETLKFTLEDGNDPLKSKVLAAGGSQDFYALRKEVDGYPTLYTSTQQNFDKNGKASKPFAFCYNQNWEATNVKDRAPSLYSPNRTWDLSDLDGNWCIRKFQKTTYGASQSAGKDSKSWDGFNNSIVDVTVELTDIRTSETSVIITNIGGFDLSKVQGGNLVVEDKDVSLSLDVRTVNTAKLNEQVSLYAPIISNVFEPSGVIPSNFNVEITRLGKIQATLTQDDFTEGKANYTFTKDGIYILKYKVGAKTVQQAITVINEQKLLISDIISGFTASQGASVVKGSKTLVGSGNTFSGLVLTGGEGATFDLDKVLDLRGVNWNNVNDYNSFVEFVIAPTGKNKFGGNFAADLNKLQFVLTDVEDADKQIVIEHRNYASGSDNNTSNYYSTVATKATGQEFACYRYYDSKPVKGDSYYHFMYEQCPKTVSFAGYQTTPVALVYSENTTYSPNAYTVATKESYALRNYNSNVITEFGALNQEKVEFSGKFKLSVIFESFSTKDSAGEYTNPDGSKPTQTSIVLTSLAGYSLNSDEIVIDRNNDVFFSNKVENSINYKESGFDFPNVGIANALLTNLSYEAVYTLYKGETVVKTGDYANDLSVTKEFVNQNGWGEYVLEYMDAYNRKFTQKYFVKPVVSVSDITKADIFVNGVKLNAGEQIALSVGDEITVEAFKGYTASVTLGDKNTNAQTYVFTKDSTFTGLTLSAEVTALEYLITFDIAEDENFTGSKPSSITYNVENAGSIVLPTPEKEGSSFLGWFVGDKKITNLQYVELKNYSLVGYFGAPYVTITYVVDGVEKVENVIKGQTPSVYIPTKSGYEFNGWVDALVGGNFVDLTNLDKNVTLYATWEEVEGIGSSKLENFKPSANLQEEQTGLSVFDYIGIAVLVMGIVGFVVAMILKGRGKQS